MVPTPLATSHSSRRLFTLLSIAVQNVPRIFSSSNNPAVSVHSLAKRGSGASGKTFIVFACLIPILVILSGIFAGLTLGYMSLDETQLNVLSISGTPKQRIYANKIKPIRKNGHLLLVTLLLANMIVNESLPVISDPVLGGGVQSVAVSTVLIVIFAEIIPQSVCTRHGLYLGAKMAGCTKVLIYMLGIVSWPVAKLLEFVLGPHHGIIYRRAELKELIAMHSSMSSHGGDLKKDTVTIIGATLDLQEKVVKQAMTPIEDVFMLSIDSMLDYALLKKICLTGHSRVPVYEEVEVAASEGPGLIKVKKIVGILLVKNCVLLDPKDAVPLRKIPLNKVPYVPCNEPLLGILDKFQEGRSHMAIVSRFSVDKAASVKQAVKRGLTQRLRDRVGRSESSDEEEKEKDKGKDEEKSQEEDGEEDGEATLKDDGAWEKEGDAAAGNSGNGNGRIDQCAAALRGRKRSKRHGGRSGKPADLEMGIVDNNKLKDKDGETAKSTMRSSFVQLPKASAGLEQSMPADAVLAKEGAEKFLQSLDPAVMPLGIITLEDVLEELIGEEIYDEFDTQGAHAELSYVPPEAHYAPILKRKGSAPELATPSDVQAQIQTLAPAMATKSLTATPVLRPIAMKGLSFLRSRSAPPTPREKELNMDAVPSPPAIDVPPDVQESGLLSDDDVGMNPLPPSVIVEQVASSPEVVSSDASAAEGISNEVIKSKSAIVPTVTVLAPSAVPGAIVATHSVSPTSRSTSPAPSLEAILLDRKRRHLNQQGVGAASNPTLALASPMPAVDVTMRPPNIRVNTPSIKGTRFKSSPLGGGERSGVVVAEKVMEDLRGTKDKHGQMGAIWGEFGDQRIPNQKDKEGPDKINED